MDSDKDENCAFCKIISGGESARVVYETEEVVAFFPLAPATRGHTLVVPKRHVADILSLDMVLGSTLLSAVLLLGRALKMSLQPDGLNVITSVGEAASQTIFHLHMHLVPRWRGDEMGDIWPAKAEWNSDLLDDLAGTVRIACAEMAS
jgi:histidine triad (HIT) family protein